MIVQAKGVIKSISEITTHDNEAKSLNYVIETIEEYPTEIAIQLYKSVDNIQHVDGFVQYNKVGDTVNFEFTIKSREYNGKFYTNCNHWSCKKVETEEAY